MGIVEQCGAAVTTAGAKSLAHNPPFPLPPHEHCKQKVWVITPIRYIQVPIEFAYSVTRLLFVFNLNFNYPWAIGRTTYFHHPFSPRRIVHILTGTLLRHIKVHLRVGKEK